MKHKFTIPDILILVVLFFLIIVASPYVIRQFMGLEKVGDIIWNISYDVVIAALVLLVAYVIDKLINRFL